MCIAPSAFGFGDGVPEMCGDADRRRTRERKGRV
jgi:hypothetical protein